MFGGLDLVSAQFCEPGQQRRFLVSQIHRRVDDELHEEIAAPTSLEVRYSPAPESPDRTGLGAGLDRE